MNSATSAVRAFSTSNPFPVNDFSALNPQIYQTDGPMGVRRNEPSIRFPSGLILAATWDPDRANDQGVSMGRDARARGYFSILGPGMDFYRVPMGGRNFEYMTGEDPFLGAQLNPRGDKRHPSPRSLGVCQTLRLQRRRREPNQRPYYRR